MHDCHRQVAIPRAPAMRHGPAPMWTLMWTPGASLVAGSMRPESMCTCKHMCRHKCTTMYACENVPEYVHAYMCACILCMRARVFKCICMCACMHALSRTRLPTQSTLGDSAVSLVFAQIGKAETAPLRSKRATKNPLVASLWNLAPHIGP